MEQILYKFTNTNIHSNVVYDWLFNGFLNNLLYLFNLKYKAITSNTEF